MKISKQDLSNIFEAAGDFDNANRYADSARKALEAGTLEIEGYELRHNKTIAPDWWRAIKLSIQELLDVFKYAKKHGYAQHVVWNDTDAWDNRERFNFLVDTLDGKTEHTVEIEGSERTGWTKFDPDDPKTFPPKDEYFDVFEKCKYEMRSVNKLNEFWWERVVERWGIQVKSRGYVIYWRPLPPPPGKEARHGSGR